MDVQNFSCFKNDTMVAAVPAAGVVVYAADSASASRGAIQICPKTCC